MIELTGNLQTVNAGGSVVFNNVIVHTGCAEKHRTNSAILTLACPGRYLVTFSGNVAIPTGGTPGEITFALSQEGEALDGATMRATPTVAEAFFNISTQHYVDVGKTCSGACCQNISVRLLSADPVTVDNANITAVRVNG